MHLAPRSAALILALAVPAFAAGVRPKPPAAPPAFGERIDVRAVNVEAVVTDRSGNRVQGLTVADFRLQVDGRDVPIDFFAEIREGQSGAPGNGTPAPPAAAGSGAVGTNYLVFLDDSFSLAPQRNVVLDKLMGDLSLLGPEDRMAILAFDGRKLDLLSTWSGETAALTEAIQRAKARPTLGLSAMDARRSFGDDQELRDQAMDDTLHPSFAGHGSDQDAAGAAAGDMMSRGTTLLSIASVGHKSAPGRCNEYFPISPKQCAELQEAINAAAGALRGLPTPGGRKVALLLSGGWPFGAGPHLFKPLLDTANQLGYTLYPVDVPGIPVEGASSGIFGSWERESKDGLEYVAAATGGKAFLNSARLDSLKRAAADTRSYYWLGFSPVWRANDKGHQVKLTVKRPGLTVRSRNGFTDLAPKTEGAMRAESALLLSPAAEDRRLRIEVGAGKRRGAVMEVAITVAVPVSVLSLSPEGKGYLAEATLALAVQDEDGGRAALSNIPLRLKLPAAPEPGSYARYQTHIKVRRVNQTVVALLHDEESGATLWDEKEIGESVLTAAGK